MNILPTSYGKIYGSIFLPVLWPEHCLITGQIWVVIFYQYGLSALIPQWSFHWETSCGVAKCWLFSLATSKMWPSVTLIIAYRGVWTSLLQLQSSKTLSNSKQNTAVCTPLQWCNPFPREIPRREISRIQRQQPPDRGTTKCFFRGH